MSKCSCIWCRSLVLVQLSCFYGRYCTTSVLHNHGFVPQENDEKTPINHPTQWNPRTHWSTIPDYWTLELIWDVVSPVGREGDHKCGNKNRNNGNKMHKILLTIAPITFFFYIKKLVINEQEGTWNIRWRKFGGSIRGAQFVLFMKII